MRKFGIIFLGKNTPTGASDWGVTEETNGKSVLLLTGTEGQCKQLAQWMNEDEKVKAAPAAKMIPSPKS